MTLEDLQHEFMILAQFAFRKMFSSEGLEGNEPFKVGEVAHLSFAIEAEKVAHLQLEHAFDFDGTKWTFRAEPNKDGRLRLIYELPITEEVLKCYEVKSTIKLMVNEIISRRFGAN